MLDTEKIAIKFQQDATSIQIALNSPVIIKENQNLVIHIK